MLKNFWQSLILMLIGTILSYYLSLHLMNKMNEDSLDYDSKDIPLKNIDLTKYEKSVCYDLIDPIDIKIKLKDIICDTTIKNDVKFVLDALKNKIPKDIPLLEIPNGILFHGPPGTGKTMLAKAIAKESNIKFLNMNISTIENKFYGESPKILKAYFSLASKIKPCILFIDEMDGLFSVRNAMDQSNINGLKTLFLTLMDGMKSKNDSIFVIGATNRLDQIDPAVKRRMSNLIEFKNPSEEDIEKYLQSFITFENDDSIEISKKLKGISFSNLYELLKYCTKQRYLQGNHVSKWKVNDIIDYSESFK